MALCGACTVHLDGVAIRSCITPVESVGASEITTIEAIGATPVGARIQKAWLDREVVQCGYCQSGQIMSAAALLARNPHPTDSQIDSEMSGNICRWGRISAFANGQAGCAINRTRRLTMNLDRIASFSAHAGPSASATASPAQVPARSSSRRRGLMLSLSLPLANGEAEAATATPSRPMRSFASAVMAG